MREDRVRERGRSSRARALLLAAAGASAAAGGLLAASGCPTATVKTTQRRVITAEEAAGAERARREQKAEDAEARAVPAARPRPPATLEEEAERLRAELQREPQNPKWHFLLGWVYERQASAAQTEAARKAALELAEIRYRRGGELIPPGKYTGPHHFLGRVLFKQGKLPQAAAELRRAVAVTPPDPEGYYLNPDYRESHFLLGVILYTDGALDDAERHFRLFLKYGGEPERVVDFFPELLAE